MQQRSMCLSRMRSRTATRMSCSAGSMKWSVSARPCGKGLWNWSEQWKAFPTVQLNSGRPSELAEPANPVETVELRKKVVSLENDLKRSQEETGEIVAKLCDAGEPRH